MHNPNPDDNSKKNVRLKRQRDGRLRAYWYGQFRNQGKQCEINLNIPWKGTPPISGNAGDVGDTLFELSREKAEAALARIIAEARQKGRVEHLTERLIESKTGRAVEYARIAELPERWRNLGRQVEVTQAHLANCDAHFRRFINFMQKRKPAAVFLYEVATEDAAAFLKELRANLAPGTAQTGICLLNKAFMRFLPVGALNPFAGFMGRRGRGEGNIFHRKPFTPEELRAILDTAREDCFMYPLIVTAACTGMRRGDVCRLQWCDVDLAAGMLAVKTSKTGANAEIPIFPPLRDVLAGRKNKGHGAIFPEAAAMLRNNPCALSRRFKVIVARALDCAPPELPPEPVPAADMEAEAAAAIIKGSFEGLRRERILDTFRRYCAGASVRQIEKATGIARATISTDLHTVEKLTGKHFLRTSKWQHPGRSINAAIARVTRAQRKRGLLSASIRDWHALRATWVTLAIAAGVPVELVRRVTGHATVEIVLKHYFRPDREQFRAALTGALPCILTGNNPAPQRMQPAEELAGLAAKLAAGTATKEDKARLRNLAAKI